jgi:hypothetical protein
MGQEKRYYSEQSQAFRSLEPRCDCDEVPHGDLVLCLGRKVPSLDERVRDERHIATGERKADKAGKTGFCVY